MKPELTSTQKLAAGTLLVLIGVGGLFAGQKAGGIAVFCGGLMIGLSLSEATEEI